MYFRSRNVNTYVALNPVLITGIICEHRTTSASGERTSLQGDLSTLVPQLLPVKGGIAGSMIYSIRLSNQALPQQVARVSNSF